MNRHRVRRRCPACAVMLPASAHPRRRYCSSACVARAYRFRKRFGTPCERLRTTGQRLDAGAGIVCPGCGNQIFPGAPGMRADARHCSPTCRQRDYRQRHDERLRDHDG